MNPAKQVRTLLVLPTNVFLVVIGCRTEEAKASVWISLNTVWLHTLMPCNSASQQGEECMRDVSLLGHSSRNAGVRQARGDYLHCVGGALLLGNDEGADLEASVLLIQDARQNAAALHPPSRIGGCIPEQPVHPQPRAISPRMRGQG